MKIIQLRKYKYILWLSVTSNVILVFIVSVFLLKYETEIYLSEPFFPKVYENDSVNFFWPEGRKMALSITFDDARISQLDSGGVALLDKYNIRGTFYVSPENIAQHVDGWKNAISKGHDIGNHTTTHPCSINFGWKGRKTLENYSLSDIRNDIITANEIIKEILGINPVSFAYPCGQTYIGEGINTKSYVPVVAEMFQTGRLYSSGTVNPVFCDMAQLPSEEMDNKSFEQILELINNASDKGQWLILTGHNVGDGNISGDNLTTSKKTLEAICEFANNPSNGIWIDNVQNIAAYITEKRGEKPLEYLSEYKKPSGSFYSKLWSAFYISKIKLKHYKYKISQKIKKS